MLLHSQYPDNEVELLQTITCEMPDEDEDLDDDFDEAWENETGEDTDEPFNDGIETDEFNLEDDPPLEFDDEEEEDGY